MKNILTVFTLVVFINTFAFTQIIFEPGYIINNSGIRQECFIKNIDWRDNPTEFSYKTRMENPERIGSIKNITEFGIYNFSKHERHTVDIERSSDYFNALSHDKNGTTTIETLFLNVIIEGNANLYSYSDQKGNFHRFYYSIGNSKVKALKYRKYLKRDLSIVTIRAYRQELYNNLKCDLLKDKNFSKLKYNANDLSKIFIKYHKCKNTNYTNFLKIKDRDKFNINAKIGLDIVDLSIDLNHIKRKDIDFKNKISYRFGFELEYILPFNKNKWSIFADPAFSKYSNNSKIGTEIASGVIYKKVNIEYNSIEFPIGIRYYIFLNNNSKLFINSAYSFNYSKNSIVTFEDGRDLDIAPRNNLFIGIGYNHKNKFSAEIRSVLYRNILGGYVYWISNYSYFSFTFGYNLYHQ